ncbi:hypothetical protein Clacol_006750 [Clathrus columnatus]|uniref:Endonuclease n=1 Tax=Clathrus columnatus TaxID=1419009 RepID=A0AAV5AFS6_9AGAM|nr:hypothetical protein Clacol_006750 [Clathrus columnatus]
MPILHVAVFAVGAAVGAGTALAITRKQQSNTLPISITKSPTVSSLVDIRHPVSSLEVPPTSGTEILKYGNPANQITLQGPIADLLSRKVYAAGYDRRLRHPAWTAEHLTRASLGRSLLEPPDDSDNGDRSRSQFEEDKSIPDPFRARLSDYLLAELVIQRVPAADAKMSQEAMNETFLLSNIAPQVGEGFNRTYWAYLERWCRDLTLSFDHVYVFTIPLYLPSRDTDGKYRVKYEVIGKPPNVAVPTHFAKVILASRPASPTTPNIAELSAGAFVLPNAPIPDETPLTNFTVPVDAVEKAAGLQILPDQIKQGARQICQTTECKVVVKRFDDARKLIGNSKSISKK